jgi:hypothetical protein
MSWFAEALQRMVTVSKGEKYMMAQTRYAGFDVPAMTIGGLKRLVARFNAGYTHICENTNDGVDCVGVSCANCILNTHIRNPGGRKLCTKAFAGYARSRGFEITRTEATACEPLPEIEAGVIYEREGRLFIVGGAVSDGWIVYPLGKGCILPNPRYHKSFWFQQDIEKGVISRVFTDGGPISSCWLTEDQIRAVANDDEAQMAFTNVRVWKWKEPPKPVREMTVDEISKALGVKVKVVGNEKADD